VAANVATGFRTNFLIYNPSNHGLHITVASGSTSKTYPVGPLQYVQVNNLGGDMGLPAGPTTIRVVGDAPWWGYVSIVDPVSGDGATILGLKKPQIPPLTVSCSATPQSGNAPLEVTFNAQGTGGDGSYTYDWDFGDGSQHATTQNPTHQYTTAGNYTATVTVTSLGKTATCTKEITVSAACTPPAITTHPTSTTICAGQSTTLSVTATGTGPLHYQWYQGAGTGNPVGTDSSSYTTPALTSTTSYWVRVTGACSPPADSNMATVTVKPATAITAWSANQTVLQVGDSTTLSGTIAGSGVTWTISQVGGTGSGTVTPSSGTGTNVSSTFTATDAGSVTLQLSATGDCGTANQTLVLTVTAPNHNPTITGLTATPNPVTSTLVSTITFTLNDTDPGDTISWTATLTENPPSAGSLDTTSGGPVSSGTGVTIHYNTGGPCNATITITATDSHGGTSQASIPILVE
jgi:PKD repeat protein